MKLKKVMALTLTAALSLSVLAGCGKDDQPASGGDTSNKEQTEQTNKGDSGQEVGGMLDTVTFPLEETMTFTAVAGMNGDYTMTDNIAMQKALADTNVQIDFTNVLHSELAEKLSTMINGNNYPDIFFKNNFDADKYGKQGIVIPLEDLIRKYAPNLTALLDERDGWQYITASDGHVYSLPQIDMPSVSRPAFWINKRWMDNLGLKEPTSFDELYEVLKAFKEQDANGNGDPDDEIPLFCNSWLNPFFLLQYADFPNTGKDGIIDGELRYVPATEEYKEFLAYATKLYQEGLMYKNSFTTQHDEQAPIGQSGDVLGSFFDAGAFLTVGRDHDEDYIALTPWDNCLDLSPGIQGGTLAISDKCQHPEVVVAWADQFYTEEGGKLAWMGVEGETYQYNDQGEWEWLLDKGHGEDITTVRASSAIQGGGQSHPSVQPRAWMESMSANVDPDEVYLNQQRLKLIEHGQVPWPKLIYTDDQQKEMSTIGADINPYVDEYMAFVVTGELKLEDSWDEYIGKLNEMGLERLEAIYKEAYDAAMNR